MNENLLEESRGNIVEVGAIKISSLEEILRKKRENKLALRAFLSFRDQMLNKFHERLNIDRAGTKYKPLPYMAVKMKLYLYTDDELHFLWKKCSEANNFSKYFYWAVKVKDRNV